ncbi:DUF1803 domain-containing protein [uncultured Enterococcus sp.]|uniref:DUF1803 domain-containing protein n=1 Tax=uncultured Enterococcus sp. TaxID=167972 RepID=UPI002584C630|nr:DUF1803 domain-containing protein [uncultured Enterococcus sp.]
MQIYTNNRKTEQIVGQLEVKKLLNYFEQLHEPVILREIRKKFPDMKHLDKHLDFLIDNGFISRKDRRYYFRLEITKEYPLNKEINDFIQEYATKFSREELLVWLGENFWSDEVGKVLVVDFPMPTRERLDSKNVRLVTINRGGELPETLPNYFEHIDQPALFPNLAKLIGDVHAEFFTNQLELILERIISGKKPRRDSIFLQSLLTSQTITSDPDWQVIVPVFENVPSVPFPAEMTKDLQFFFARQLADSLLKEQKSFTYLIKKRS